METLLEVELMRKYRWRVVIIAIAFALWSLMTFWLIFGLHASRVIGNNRVIYLILALVALLPLVFYHWVAKRAPRYATALGLLGAGLVLVSLDGIAVLVFNVSDIWTERIVDLAQVLFALVAMIFIWQSVKQSKESKKWRKHKFNTRE